MPNNDAPPQPEPTDGSGESTLTPRTGQGAQSALEALRRQQQRKPRTVNPVPGDAAAEPDPAA